MERARNKGKHEQESRTEFESMQTRLTHASHYLARVEIRAFDRVVVATQIRRRGDERNVKIRVVVLLKVGRDDRSARGGCAEGRKNIHQI